MQSEGRFGSFINGLQGIPLNRWLVLVNPVGGPNGRSENSEVELIAESERLLGVSIVRLVFQDGYILFDPADLADLRLDPDTFFASLGTNPTGQFDVLFIRLV